MEQEEDNNSLQGWNIYVLRNKDEGGLAQSDTVELERINRKDLNHEARRRSKDTGTTSPKWSTVRQQR